MGRHVKVGDTVNSGNWGLAEILSRSVGITTVKFLDTGNVQEVKNNVLKGRFVDEKAYEDKLGRKRTKRGSINIGSIFSSNHWGDAEVVEVLAGTQMRVKFILSGNFKECRTSELIKGNFEDTTAREQGVARLDYEHPNQTSARISTGAIFKSNMWGDVEVVEYRSNKDIDIKFLESGNVINVQKVNLENGFVKDIVRQKLETSTKNSLIEDEVERSRKEVAVLREQGRLQRVEENKKRVEAYQRRLVAEAKAREEKRLSELGSVTYNSSYGGEYKISRLLSGVECEVTFYASGNIERVTVQKASKGNVVDTGRFSPEQVEAIRKEKNAAYYLNNREANLQKAKDYQKSKP